MSIQKQMLILLSCLLSAMATMAQEKRTLRHQFETTIGTGRQSASSSDNLADVLVTNKSTYFKMNSFRYSFYVQPNWGLYANVGLIPSLAYSIDKPFVNALYEDQYYVLSNESKGTLGGYPNLGLGAQYRIGKKHWFARVRVGAVLNDLGPDETELILKGKGSNEMYRVTYSPFKEPNNFDNTHPEILLELGLSVDYHFTRTFGLTTEIGYQQSFKRHTMYMQKKDYYTHETVEQETLSGKRRRNELYFTVGVSVMLYTRRKR